MLLDRILLFLLALMICSLLDLWIPLRHIYPLKGHLRTRKEQSGLSTLVLRTCKERIGLSALGLRR